MGDSPRVETVHHSSTNGPAHVTVRLTWTFARGNVELVSVAVAADDPPLALRDVRDLRLGALVEAGRREAAAALLGPKNAPATNAQVIHRTFKIPLGLFGDERATDRPSPPRRPPREGREQQVAIDYTHLSMVTSKPTTALAELYGVPYSTAAKWVWQARKAGLLPTTEPGKARSDITHQPKED